MIFSIDLGSPSIPARVHLKTVMNSVGYYAEVIKRLEYLCGELGFEEVEMQVDSTNRGYTIQFATRKRGHKHRIGWKFPRSFQTLGPAAFYELTSVELINAQAIQQAIP